MLWWNTVLKSHPTIHLQCHKKYFHLTKSSSYFIRTIIYECIVTFAVFSRYIVFNRNWIIMIRFAIDKNVFASRKFKSCLNFFLTNCVCKFEFLFPALRNILYCLLNGNPTVPLRHIIKLRESSTRGEQVKGKHCLGLFTFKWNRFWFVHWFLLHGVRDC